MGLFPSITLPSIPNPVNYLSTLWSGTDGKSALNNIVDSAKQTLTNTADTLVHTAQTVVSTATPIVNTAVKTAEAAFAPVVSTVKTVANTFAAAASTLIPPEPTPTPAPTPSPSPSQSAASTPTKLPIKDDRCEILKVNPETGAVEYFLNYQQAAGSIDGLIKAYPPAEQLIKNWLTQYYVGAGGQAQAKPSPYPPDDPNVPDNVIDISPPAGSDFEATAKYLAQFKNWQPAHVNGGSSIVYVYGGGLVDAMGKTYTGYTCRYGPPQTPRPGGPVSADTRYPQASTFLAPYQEQASITIPSGTTPVPSGTPAPTGSSGSPSGTTSDTPAPGGSGFNAWNFLSSLWSGTEGKGLLESILDTAVNTLSNGADTLIDWGSDAYNYGRDTFDDGVNWLDEQWDDAKEKAGDLIDKGTDLLDDGTPQPNEWANRLIDVLAKNTPLLIAAGAIVGLGGIYLLSRPSNAPQSVPKITTSG